MQLIAMNAIMAPINGIQDPRVAQVVKKGNLVHPQASRFVLIVKEERQYNSDQFLSQIALFVMKDITEVLHIIHARSVLLLLELNVQNKASSPMWMPDITGQESNRLFHALLPLHVFLQDMITSRVAALVMMDCIAAIVRLISTGLVWIASNVQVFS